MVQISPFECWIPRSPAIAKPLGVGAWLADPSLQEQMMKGIFSLVLAVLSVS